MSDSVRPHRRQPTRLCHPWDSPGKSTGVGRHFLLQCMKVKSESEVTQSCPTLHDPMDSSLPGSSVHGIFQARGLEWGAKNLYYKTNENWITYVKYLFKCIAELARIQGRALESKVKKKLISVAVSLLFLNCSDLPPRYFLTMDVCGFLSLWQKAGTLEVCRKWATRKYLSQNWQGIEGEK